MANRFKRPLARVCAVGVAGLLWSVTPTYADHDPYPMNSGPNKRGVEYLEDDCHDASVCGVAGPLMPVPASPIHVGLLWSSNDWENPSMLSYVRQSDMSPTDLMDEACMERIIINSTIKGRTDPYACA